MLVTRNTMLMSRNASIGGRLLIQSWIELSWSTPLSLGLGKADRNPYSGNEQSVLLFPANDLNLHAGISRP
jgi:hypothetical protein